MLFLEGTALPDILLRDLTGFKEIDYLIITVCMH